jgi:nucleoid DNA-binding protein
MNKMEFYDFVYGGLKSKFGDTITKKGAKEFADEFVDAFLNACKEDAVKTKLGKFEVKTIKGHNGINPKTKERIWIESTNALRFSPSANTKKVINE